MTQSGQHTKYFIYESLYYPKGGKYMKIYNINDTHEFFERLSACEGRVELIDEKGARFELLHGKRSSGIVPLFSLYGNIRQIELKFEKAEDCSKIFSYLINKRKASA